MTPVDVVLPSKAQRGYFVTVGLAVAAFALTAFAPGIFHQRHRLAPLSLLAAMHGLSFLAWLCLFVAQAWLAANKRMALHRLVGKASAALVVVMLALGYQTAIRMAARGFDLDGVLPVRLDPLAYLIFPLGDLVSFALLFAAGIYFRRQSEVHKRLMLLATLGGVMPAICAHLLGELGIMARVTPLILAVVFWTPAIYDRVRLGRFQQVTLWVGPGLWFWAMTRALLIGPTKSWHHFAAWLVHTNAV